MILAIEYSIEQDCSSLASEHQRFCAVEIRWGRNRTNVKEKNLGRSETGIFAELEALCASPGFIHAIAYICMRDNMIKYTGEMSPEDMANLYGLERLVRNEVNVLVGLLIKNEIDYSRPAGETLEHYVKQAEALLEEIHRAMLAPVIATISENLSFPDIALNSGIVLREAIFYGGESAYMFQYRDFAPQRYGQDDAWMIANKGFTVGEAASVVKAVGKLRNEKSTVAFRAAKNNPDACGNFLPSHEFNAVEVARIAGVPEDLADRVLSAFALPVGERNEKFKAIDDRNSASIFPLIRCGKRYILFNIFDLSEVLYQAPYFWMLKDQAYQPTANEHRGEFTERFAESCLVSVFGRKNVRTNINLMRSKSTVGEFDVLVVFGDVAIVLQAKSKQLTAVARQGNEAKLKSDFGAAVQDACDQGYAYGHLLFDPTVTLQDAAGNKIATPTGIRKIYVVCLIADHYPALSFQARQFLQFNPTDRLSPPFVMDVFLLDAMAELLDTPLHFLSYLERRATYHETVMSSHELNILGFHLSHNLWMDGRFDGVHLDDTMGTSLELSMLVRREHVPGPWTPPGILTRMANTRLGAVVRQIEKEANPSMLALGYLLLRMSEATFVDLSGAIDELMLRAQKDGRAHNATVQLSGTKDGLTIHVNSDSLEVAERNLVSYCAMRKYAQRSNSWFGLVLDPYSGSIRFGAHANSAWVKDPEMDLLTKIMQKSAPVKSLASMRSATKKKIGRNEPCDCGSGKKSKRCCYV